MNTQNWLRAALLSLTCLGASVAQAEDLLLGDIKAQGATQLSGTELKKLMDGASITRKTANGSTQNWTHDPDGKMMVGSDRKGNVSLNFKTTSFPGTWSANENGTYCVNIEYPSKTENWCHFVFKAGDQYYFVKSPNNNADPVKPFSVGH